MARHLIYAICVITIASALTWPVFDLVGNRIEPRIFGLPFTLIWNVGWVLFSFLALLIYHLTDPEER